MKEFVRKDVARRRGVGEKKERAINKEVHKDGFSHSWSVWPG